MAQSKFLDPHTPIAVSLGDPAGISLEILYSSISELGPCVIWGAQCYRPNTLPPQCQWQTVPGELILPGQPSAESGRQAFLAFEAASRAVAIGNCRALVTLPLSKEHVALTMPRFHGHTDQLNEWWGGESLMTLLGGDLKVALVTDHEAINDVPKLMTKERVLKKARTLRKEIKQFFTKGKEPQLHLLGLNPHAGEKGLIGDEDQILVEAIKTLNAEGATWQGPWPADAFFARHNYGDAVLAIYHDQGLIPVKMLANGNGVNITLGLPHVRTSPDHGTAFDIAGQNKADPSSFVTAFRLAEELSL